MRGYAPRIFISPHNPPPLCKGRCLAFFCKTEGLSHAITTQKNNPSVNFVDSSLYTREPSESVVVFNGSREPRNRFRTARSPSKNATHSGDVTCAGYLPKLRASWCNHQRKCRHFPAEQRSLTLTRANPAGSPYSRQRVAKKKNQPQGLVSLFGDLAGNRTRDCAVRGRRLNLLTTRPYLFCLYTISHFLENINCFYAVFLKFFHRIKTAVRRKVLPPLFV